MAAALMFAGAFFAACGDDNKDSDSSAVDTTTTAAAASGTVITITATDFKFDQTALTAKAGEAVTFTLKNDGEKEHNLTIEALKVDKDAEEGESASQTVTPTAGTYEYFCHYHPDAMKGTLTVS